MSIFVINEDYFAFKGREEKYPRVYTIGNFVNQWKYQDKKFKAPYTLKQVEEIVKQKGWKQVSRKVIDDLRVKEIAEVL